VGPAVPVAQVDREVTVDAVVAVETASPGLIHPAAVSRVPMVVTEARAVSAVSARTRPRRPDEVATRAAVAKVEQRVMAAQAEMLRRARRSHLPVATVAPAETPGCPASVVLPEQPATAQSPAGPERAGLQVPQGVAVMVATAALASQDSPPATLVRPAVTVATVDRAAISARAATVVTAVTAAQQRPDRPPSCRATTA
jgi:hypothetical protein